MNTQLNPCKKCGTTFNNWSARDYCWSCWQIEDPAGFAEYNALLKSNAGDGVDWPDSIDDHPFATVTQDDLDSYSDEIFDDDDSDWDIDNEDEDGNDSDPLDVCPFCGSRMQPGSDMCTSCRREREGYRS